MKRFLQFILFVFLLSSAVSALYLWKTRRDGDTWGFGTPTSSAGGKRVPEKFTPAKEPAIDVKDVDILAAMSRQQIKLAAAVIPSVVSIATQRNVRQRPADPWAELFSRLDPRQNRPQSSLGSGAIVSKEGHIVTNNHVIEGMDQIRVHLHDGRELPARVIGTAPNNDLAILKVDAGDLKPLPFGDSDQVEVGEMVFAVGNPFGLDETLTQGIISAKGRRTSENGAEFLQTDAAINPGNSGGPLVSVRGELVGINTMIYSQTGGSVGIGFAIPSAVVRRILESVLKNGRVIRGYLGVSADNRPAGNDQPGVRVAEVTPNSPAEAAGIKPGDVIVKFNDRAVKDIMALRNRIAETEIDKNVPIELVRDGKPMTVSASIKEVPAEGLAQANPGQPGSPFQPRPRPQQPGPPSGGSGSGKSAPLDQGNPLAGIEVTELTGRVAQQMNLPGNIRGVVVRGVARESNAAAYLREGDVIEEVNQQPVSSPDEFREAATMAARGGGDVMLQVIRGRARSFVIVPSER
ncbi:MAG: trypsin-like peptidase domain-containing protein [Verrucomicrobia bacterium]|nr:trypsin-like peptidase domain-containing protein [Verrucomicrobiota bacterium]